MVADLRAVSINGQSETGHPEGFQAKKGRPVAINRPHLRCYLTSLKPKKAGRVQPRLFRGGRRGRWEFQSIANPV